MVSTIRTAQLAQEVTSEALEQLLKDVVRYRRALQFYAAEKNYLDGAPQIERQGQLIPDDGWTAQDALRLNDYSLGLVVKVEEESQNETAA
jgi:hypothetical protein